MSNLSSKIALVTGASRGIGKAVALALAAQGADVGVHFHAYEIGADETCRKISEMGSNCIKIQADVAKSEDIVAMVKAMEREFGNVQILINNAGIVHRDILENMSEEEWDRVMDINLKSAFLVTQGCLPGMRREKWGRIVYLSSVAAQTGGITDPIYVASKAGLIGLAHSYASLLVKEGITVNAVAPALIETDMVRAIKANPASIPVGRFGQPQEVADVVVTLIKNGYMTGQTINVNGGLYFS